MDNSCVTVYFNRIVFDRHRVLFDIDIVHNQFKTRVHILNSYAYVPPFLLFAPEKELNENVVNLLQMGSIEEGKTAQIKFMSSDVRDFGPIQRLLEYLKRFEIVKDNIIFVEMKNRKED